MSTKYFHLFLGSNDGKLAPSYKNPIGNLGVALWFLAHVRLGAGLNVKVPTLARLYPGLLYLPVAGYDEFPW